jgi:hypothetical protein
MDGDVDHDDEHAQHDLCAARRRFRVRHEHVVLDEAAAKVITNGTTSA